MSTSTWLLCLISVVLVSGKSKDAGHLVISPTIGLLYPRESETRDVRSLDGLWRFLKCNASDAEQGIREQWYERGLNNIGYDTITMPVPASYNDVTVDAGLHDHVGTVWYERNFFVPAFWQSQRIWLRFGSVHYNATVWINGKLAMSHCIGHLPFEANITKYVKFGEENRVTVACDNRLNNHTIPQGNVARLPSDNGQVYVQTYTFDFFNYAGIHRSVHLHTTPVNHIRDISIHTSVTENGVGRIDYAIILSNTADALNSFLELQLSDQDGKIVAKQTNKFVHNGTLLVSDVKPWWPYLMHDRPGYMYNLKFALYHKDNSKLQDVYRLPVGIRNLSWNNESLLVNQQPVYLRGFGKHEDSDIRGKGLDLALITRDFSLLKWMGANAYRTSHYPYSEESMQFADQHGIMIIDECPSVNTDIFQQQLLQNHMSALEQLIHRDHNHASVIAWSIANEPRTAKNASKEYFHKLVNYTRSISHGRPLTAAINVESGKDKLAQFLDIVGFNRYNGWYQNIGHLDMITNTVYHEALGWHKLYKKPIIMFEYGADTMEGYHAVPSFMWSEDYQRELFSKHFQAFDQLRKLHWFIGEFVWNFADFKTPQAITRVGGNKKGVFTRNRQPKAAANLLRQRYYALAFQLNNVTFPVDVFNYIIDWSQ